MLNNLNDYGYLNDDMIYVVADDTTLMLDRKYYALHDVLAMLEMRNMYSGFIYYVGQIVEFGCK